MNQTELRDFLYQKIPLVKAMGTQVLTVDGSKIEVTAPLDINNNHMGTAFGGSLNSLLITSCYAWLFYMLDKEGFSLHVLIKSGQTDYLKPVKENLKAICISPPEDEYKKFFSSFERKGKAKIFLEAYIETSEGVACTFKGEFVAVSKTSKF